MYKSILTFLTIPIILLTTSCNKQDSKHKFDPTDPQQIAESAIHEAELDVPLQKSVCFGNIPSLYMQWEAAVDTIRSYNLTDLPADTDEEYKNKVLDAEMHAQWGILKDHYLNLMEFQAKRLENVKIPFEYPEDIFSTGKATISGVSDDVMGTRINIRLELTLAREFTNYPYGYGSDDSYGSGLCVYLIKQDGDEQLLSYDVEPLSLRCFVNDKRYYGSNLPVGATYITGESLGVRKDNINMLNGIKGIKLVQNKDEALRLYHAAGD